ncbi:hypothetical protein ACLKA7_007668 [Drosophila subpalustris]
MLIYPQDVPKVIEELQFRFGQLPINADAFAKCERPRRHRQQEQRQTNHQNDHLDPNTNFIELFKRQQIQIDRLMDGMAKMQQIVAAALHRSGGSTASAQSSPNQQPSPHYAHTIFTD